MINVSGSFLIGVLAVLFETRVLVQEGLVTVENLRVLQHRSGQKKRTGAD